MRLEDRGCVEGSGVTHSTRRGRFDDVRASCEVVFPDSDFESSMLAAGDSFERDVEGDQTIEQRGLAIEMTLAKATAFDLFPSVFEQTEPEQRSENPGLHRFHVGVGEEVDEGALVNRLLFALGLVFDKPQRLLPDCFRQAGFCGQAFDAEVFVESLFVPSFMRAQRRLSWPAFIIVALHAHCDKLFFAVDVTMPAENLPTDAGLIVADAFGGAIIRDAPVHRITGATRPLCFGSRASAQTDSIC